MSKERDPRRDSAPQPRCRCAACRWLNQNAELRENYARYEAGDLVAKRGKD